MSPHTPYARILILDDHVIIRRGLRNLITLKLPYLVVHDVATIRGLLALLSVEGPPTLLILDLQLSDGNAMEHIEDIRRAYPGMRILVYSMNPERLYAQRVIALGCAGYLNKEAPEDEVIKAIRHVLDGKVYIGHGLEMQSLDRGGTHERSPFERLSKQELLVLDHILAGLGVKEISQRMGIGISTAATYKARLFEKLDVQNALELQTLVNAHGYRRT
ncbi:MAG: response regulator transcription factor [Flavobacteriales bacterium]|nr:response regulator transcription factor [Flavobacteriales bacterium]